MNPPRQLEYQALGLLEALDAGVTTTLDHAHSAWTNAHMLASLNASIDSGARVFWCPQVTPVTVSANPFTGAHSSLPLPSYTYLILTCLQHSQLERNHHSARILEHARHEATFRQQ